MVTTVYLVQNCVFLGSVCQRLHVGGTCVLSLAAITPTLIKIRKQVT